MKKWIGQWVDTDGSRMTISQVSEQLEVTKYVDSFGESFEVRSFERISGRHYVLCYYVPSTRYNVKLELRREGKKRLSYTWCNDHGAQNEEDEISYFVKQ